MREMNEVRAYGYTSHVQHVNCDSTDGEVILSLNKYVLRTHYVLENLLDFWDTVKNTTHIALP